MEAGAQVWCQDLKGDAAWIYTEVLLKTDTELKLGEVGNLENTFVRKRDPLFPDILKFEGVELANAKLSDQEREDGMDDDLIALPHLHEPALLHAVGERFTHSKIYTWTGPVLIAMNPFKRLPLYTTEILEAYRQEGLLKSQNIQNNHGKPCGPHIYAIADRSYRQMTKNNKSQSVLISGESGAGKTESTKIVMLYLTTLGSNSQEPAEEEAEEKKEELSVMERVLQSNPILECFGNARTLRNDNSSRFGKFIELGFSRSGCLMGAKVQTYLLEKVRLANHASGERNYHIFYQLVRGASEEQKKKYGFHDAWTGGVELANYFNYTGQGGAPQLREFSDEDGFKYTLKGMQSMAWPEEKIDKVLGLIAGLLHLGQITFEGKESDSGEDIATIADMTVVTTAADLLGVDIEMFTLAITERLMVTRDGEIKIPLSPEKAADARDALAKTIYGSLFLWVVMEVNKIIGWEDDKEIRSSIGVLDIFGFECFAINSFEQLCINFTNESLQQSFNKFVFKMEQNEYEAEEINWAFVEFPDNQDCLETIQGRPNGILTMLDDECRVPRGSDKNFAQRLYKVYLPDRMTISENTRIHASAIQKAKGIFCIRHYAGKVAYTSSTGFLEKNKDEIPLSAKKLFENAPTPLIREVYEVQRADLEDRAKPSADAAKAKPGGRGGSKQPKTKTVGQQFKEQLTSLMNVVESTEPHYIRCLKPNDMAKPIILTRKRVTEQLRCGGVLEAVRVARMGYPVRMKHIQFFQRYRMLLPSVKEEIVPFSVTEDEGSVQKHCVKILDILIEQGEKEMKGESVLAVEVTRAEQVRRQWKRPPPITFPKADVQLGNTKVFMRKPPHDALESHRVFHQNAIISLMQSAVRGAQAYQKYYILCTASRLAERWYRGCKGRERWWRIKREQCSHLLTVNFRMLIIKRRYMKLKHGMIVLQATHRGRHERRVLATIELQTRYRLYKARKAYRQILSATIALQCQHRVNVATKSFNELKSEQKNVGKLKGMNEKLKSEMASLRAMLNAQAAGSAISIEMNEKLDEKQKEVDGLEKKIKQLEREIEEKKTVIEKLEKGMASQKEASKRQVADLENRIHNAPPSSPRAHYTAPPHAGNLAPPPAPPPPMIHPKSPRHYSKTNAVDNETLQQHLMEIARLEEDLSIERKMHRAADSEIIKLRAQMSGVQLDENDLKALSGPMSPGKPDQMKRLSIPSLSMPGIAESPTDKELKKQEEKNAIATPAPVRALTGELELEKKEDKEFKKLKRESITPQVMSALSKLGVEMGNSTIFQKKEDKPPKPKPKPKPEPTPRKKLLLRSPSDYFPMVRRGFMGGDDEKAQEEVMAVNWKVDITNRKEREESLRDEVRRFEIKMKKFYSTLEAGVDVMLWQLNRNTEKGGKDDFPLKSAPISLKLHRRGDMLCQAMITFCSRGNYMSKAFSRGDKDAIDPLSLHEVLEVKSGCAGIDSTMLPGTTKGKEKIDPINKQVNLFLTIKASPTPLASSRIYIVRFKSRSARNDLMNGLRGLLADMQVKEGVGISTIQNQKKGENGPPSSPASASTPEAEEIMVPLADVHKAINKERQMYDRLLLMMLQSFEDVKEKEDQYINLFKRLETVATASRQKDMTQANDSKLIMQLSKKLETLLMDNEDLRDQNERLNGRLIAAECEKMNLLRKK